LDCPSAKGKQQSLPMMHEIGGFKRGLPDEPAVQGTSVKVLPSEESKWQIPSPP